jgi:hypothetical protein
MPGRASRAIVLGEVKERLYRLSEPVGESCAWHASFALENGCGSTPGRPENTHALQPRPDGPHAPALRDRLRQGARALFISDVVDALDLTPTSTVYGQGDGRGRPSGHPVAQGAEPRADGAKGTRSSTAWRRPRKRCDEFGRLGRVGCTAADLTFFQPYGTLQTRAGAQEFKLAPVPKSIYSPPALQDLMRAATDRYLAFLAAIEDPTPGAARPRQDRTSNRSELRASGVDSLPPRVRLGGSGCLGLEVHDAITRPDGRGCRAALDGHIRGRSIFQCSRESRPAPS